MTRRVVAVPAHSLQPIRDTGVWVAGLWVAGVLFAGFLFAPSAGAIAGDRDERPILEVNGDTLEEGELQWLLRQRPLPDSGPVARQAAAAVLVRRQLACQSLFAIGGAALQQRVDRELAEAEQRARSQGRSLDEIAAQQSLTLAAYRRHLTWQVAWREYLKSRMTDGALRQFYERNRDRYSRPFLVSQIFLAADASPPGEADREQRLQSLAESLRRERDLSAAFARAARQHSEAGSSENGGAVGWVGMNGDLPGELLVAIRQAAAGELIGPLRSPLGWHLVLVREQRIDSASFDALTDHALLRHDFAEALFLHLVSRQEEPAVRYLDESLRPAR